jgi:tetratricopeptide (TPR) repeat protein
MKAMVINAEKRPMTAVWAVCVFGLLLAAGLRAAPEIPAPGALTPEAIVELARAGRNTEAIEGFEALADKSEQPLVLMRAVAGCYWRERRFEEARALYQQILERRPNLKALSDRSDAKPATAKPLLDRPRANADADADADADAEESARSAPSTGPEDQVRDRPAPPPPPPPQADRPAAAEGVEPEGGEDTALVALREEYAALEKRGRERRDELLARIDSLEQASVLAGSEMRELRQALNAERSKREALATTAQAAESKLTERGGEQAHRTRPRAGAVVAVVNGRTGTGASGIEVERGDRDGAYRGRA